MRVAAVDIGTNTVRLLVVDDVEVARIERVCRLGEGVEHSGMLSEAAMERTLGALRGFADELGRCDRVRVVATSASRDAANREVFFDSVEDALGHRPELISGDEEAALSFAGATRARSEAGSTLVIDIGGGSTEFVVGERSPSYATSLQLGSVRLTDRLLPDRPAVGLAVDVALAHVIDRVYAAEVPAAERTIGVAGTWTALAGIDLDLTAWDPMAVHGSQLAVDGLKAIVDWLAGMTVSETAAIPSLAPERAPVMLAGAVVALGSMLALDIETVEVSIHDLLDGVVAALVPE